MKNYEGLKPSYPGDSIGHIVSKEIGSKSSRSMVPKKVDGEIVGWMPIKRSQKIRVAFKWDGKEWVVYKVG